MSLARLVITAVVLEGRSQAEVARSYGLSRSWVSRLVKRYELEGMAAFEPRSRRPKTLANALDSSVVDLICEIRRDLSGQGLDAGPATIRWHLEHHHRLVVAESTIIRSWRRVIEKPGDDVTVLASNDTCRYQGSPNHVTSRGALDESPSHQHRAIIAYLHLQPDAWRLFEQPRSPTHPHDVGRHDDPRIYQRRTGPFPRHHHDSR